MAIAKYVDQRLLDKALEDVKALARSNVSITARSNIFQSIVLTLLDEEELTGSDWDYITEKEHSNIQERITQLKNKSAKAGFIAGFLYALGEFDELDVESAEYNANTYTKELK